LCEATKLADKYSAIRKGFSIASTNANFGAGSHESKVTTQQAPETQDFSHAGNNVGKYHKSATIAKDVICFYYEKRGTVHHYFYAVRETR